MATWYNRLVGSPKWAYEGVKGEVVSVGTGIAGAIGGLGDYVVDSVSDIAYGTGGRHRRRWRKCGPWARWRYWRHFNRGNSTCRTIRKGSYSTAINRGRILFIKKIKEKYETK